MILHFISDLHLQDARPDLTAGFLRYLSGPAQQADMLYILGDFFEFWIGDDVATPTSDNVAQALRARADQGGQTCFLAGNRDFLLGKDYADRCGMTLLSGAQVLTIGGQRTVLVHGDELCTDDTQYQQFRQMVRNPTWQQAFLAMPVTQRLQMAGQARSESAQATSDKAAYIMDVNADAVQALLTEHHATRLIHGHTHRPARHQLNVNGQPAERIVLGDWGSHGWLLSADEHDLTLSSFPLQH